MKNLIISFIKNKPLIDGENKDRQDLENFTTAKTISNNKIAESIIKTIFCFFSNLVKKLNNGKFIFIILYYIVL